APSSAAASPSPSSSAATSPSADSPAALEVSDDFCHSAGPANSASESSATYPNPAPSQLPSNSLQMAVDVIRRQFDLEILLKHRELSCIEDEIAKVHVMMLQLRRCAGQMLDESANPDDFTRHYAQYLLPDRRYSDSNSSYSSVPAGTASSSLFSPASSSTSSGMANSQADHPRSVRDPIAPFSRTQRPQPEGCVYRRQDGILVRLVCKDCSRNTFGSAQGFINHCRISHAREFTSHDNAALCCGVELEESEQDDVGLGALKHRRHMELAASPNMSPFPSLPIHPSVAASVAASVASASKSASSSSSSSAGAQPVSTLNAAGKRDYGTKCFPWNYQPTASSSFIAQPITPPNEIQFDQVPRHVPDLSSDSSPTPSGTIMADQVVTVPNGLLSARNSESSARTPSTTRLSTLLKRKQIDLDGEEVDEMARKAIKRDPRGHLFPGEQDVSDGEEENRMPSVAKFKKMISGTEAGVHRGRMGSGMRILAN
ncbi:uncharacterized protein V1516DRAFT_614536, partial [Lipomyces oligophaga]|uniref:uncharacterized protein n=1 Tax=Lipomyces oligophaga TaxID=45792 RepID=UPI0034CE1235